MTTANGIHGKGHWAAFGVTLPDHLSDAEADKLMGLILGSPDTPWEETLALIGKIAVMPRSDIAKLAADRDRELQHLCQRTSKQPDLVVEDLAATITEHCNWIESTVDWRLSKDSVVVALRVEAVFRLLALDILKDRQEFNVKRAKAHLARGLVRAHQKSFRDAIADYDTALALYSAEHLRDDRELDDDRVKAYINRSIARGHLWRGD